MVYRDNKKQQYLFVGKVTRRFLHEKDSAAAALEVKCLKKKHGVTDNILEVVPSSEYRYRCLCYAWSDIKTFNSDTKDLEECCELWHF